MMTSPLTLEETLLNLSDGRVDPDIQFSGGAYYLRNILSADAAEALRSDRLRVQFFRGMLHNFSERFRLCLEAAKEDPLKRADSNAQFDRDLLALAGQIERAFADRS